MAVMLTEERYQDIRKRVMTSRLERLAEQAVAEFDHSERVTFESVEDMMRWLSDAPDATD